MTYFFNNLLGLPFVLAAALAPLSAGALFGYVQDRFFWRWLRKRGTGLIAMLVVSIGFGILLRYIYLFFFGGNTSSSPTYSGQAGLAFGPVDITPKALIGGGASPIVVLIGTVLWLQTDPRSARQPARSPTTRPWPRPPASTSKRVITVVWMVGAALAAPGRHHLQHVQRA